MRCGEIVAKIAILKRQKPDLIKKDATSSGPYHSEALSRQLVVYLLKLKVGYLKKWVSDKEEHFELWFCSRRACVIRVEEVLANMPPEIYIASLDVGTTTVRCFILDSKLREKGSSTDSIELISPLPGYFEINPDKLWKSVVAVISNAIKNANLTPVQITCLAISTQRCSFITWDKETDDYFHNFVTWKDLRADSLVKKWNSGVILNTINKISYVLYLFTRSKRFLAGAVLKMMNSQVTLRLLWQMQNNEKLKAAIQKKTALFGTLDSWLLYKLRKGTKKEINVDHISDVTSCTATGFYDPFTLSWASWAFSIFSIKAEMLPTVVDNNYKFGYVHETIFGTPIKIGASLSDSAAAMWGSHCFKEGDVKITLGTGSFLNLNTSSSCHASMHGLYPLVAWKFSGTKLDVDNLVYCVEGAANDTGTVINWAINLGFFDDPSKTSEIAESVEDSDGVYFIPAFSGLGPPINDNQAATGFLGIRPTTTKAQLVRALLESIAFRVAQIYECTVQETNYTLNCIKVDGGVSKNDFICQLLADLTGLNVERGINSESSAFGAAYVAGINEDIWTMDDIHKFRQIGKLFLPRSELKEKLVLKMKIWEKAVERFKGWYIT